MKGLKNIAVIGSGTMGNGIAHVAGQSNLKTILIDIDDNQLNNACLLYTSPSPRDQRGSRMPSSA